MDNTAALSPGTLVILAGTIVTLAGICAVLAIRHARAAGALRERESQVAALNSDAESARLRVAALEQELAAENEKLSALRVQAGADRNAMASREKELEDTRERAREASRTKSLFVANMSHELRTPLNGILGLTRNLLDSTLSPEQKSEVELIQIAGEDLVRIVNDVLDLSKLEAGKLALERVPFDLPDMVESIFSLLYPQAQRKQLTYILTYSQRMHRQFVSDPFRIRQVVLNLLSNAIKFTQSGSVVLHVEEGGRQGNAVWIRFVVSDTGIGIEANKQEMIFDEFQQADLSTTRRFGGTGLGLSLSKRIVDLLGGELLVESEIHQGSRFTVQIPLTVVPGQDTAARHLQADENSFDGIRVLVQDRHTPRSTTLIRVMEALPGVTVQLYQTVEDAEAILLNEEDTSVDALVCTDASTSFGPEEAHRLIARLGAEAPRLLVLSELSPFAQVPGYGNLNPIVIASPVLPSRVIAILRQLRKAPLGPLFESAGVTVYDVYRDAGASRERAPTVLLAHENPVELRVMEGMLSKLGVHYISARSEPHLMDELAARTYRTIICHSTLVGPRNLDAIGSRLDSGSAGSRLILLGELDEAMGDVVKQWKLPFVHFAKTPRLAQLRDLL